MTRTKPKKEKKPKINKKAIEKELDVLWSQVVRSRDKHCVKCGGNYGLQAHHIFSRRHKSTRWDVHNGVALCTGCHIFWAHRDTGGFVAWWMDKYGEDKFRMLSQLSNVVFKPNEEYYSMQMANLKEWLK